MKYALRQVAVFSLGLACAIPAAAQTIQAADMAAGLKTHVATGVYSVTVEAPGFRPYLQNGVTLTTVTGFFSVGVNANTTLVRDNFAWNDTTRRIHGKCSNSAGGTLSYQRMEIVNPSMQHYLGLEPVYLDRRWVVVIRQTQLNLISSGGENCA